MSMSKQLQLALKHSGGGSAQDEALKAHKLESGRTWVCCVCDSVNLNTRTPLFRKGGEWYAYVCRSCIHELAEAVKKMSDSDADAFRNQWWQENGVKV